MRGTPLAGAAALAFGVAIGLPIALYALRALAKAEPIALAVAAIVIAALAARSLATELLFVTAW